MLDLVPNPEDKFSSDMAHLQLIFGCKKLCCNSHKIQTKRPNLKVFCQKHANGIANSEDPDQTAPVGAV